MFTPHPGARTQPHRSIYNLDQDKENTTNRFPTKTPGRKPMLLGGGAGGPSTIHGKASHASQRSSMSHAPSTVGKQAQRGDTAGGKVAPKTVAVERIGVSQGNANQATGKKPNGGLLGKGKGAEKDGPGGTEEIAPKLLFSKQPSTSTQTPSKQTSHPASTGTTKKAQFASTLQTPAPSKTSTTTHAQIEALRTPLPSATRRRKSRQSSSSASGRNSTGSGGFGSAASTPMKQAQLGPQTPYHSSLIHAGTSSYTQGRASIGGSTSSGNLLSPASALMNASFVTPVRKNYGDFGSGQLSPLGFGSRHGQGDEGLDDQDPDASFGSSLGGMSGAGGGGGMIRSSSGLEGLMEVNEDGDEMMEMLDMRTGEVQGVGMDLDQMDEEDLEIEYMPPRGIPLPDLPPFHDEVTPIAEIIARFKGCPSNWDFADPNDPDDFAFQGWTMERLGMFDDEMLAAGGWNGGDADGKCGGIRMKSEIELEDPRFRRFATLKQQRLKRERKEAEQQQRQAQADVAASSPEDEQSGGSQATPLCSNGNHSKVPMQFRKISLDRVMPSSEIPLPPGATPPITGNNAVKGSQANKTRALQNGRPSFPAGAGRAATTAFPAGSKGKMGFSTMAAKDKVFSPAFRQTSTSKIMSGSTSGMRSASSTLVKPRANPNPSVGTSSTLTKASGSFPKPAVLTPPSGNKARAGAPIRSGTLGRSMGPTFIRSTVTAVKPVKPISSVKPVPGGSATAAEGRSATASGSRPTGTGQLKSIMRVGGVAAKPVTKPVIRKSDMAVIDRSSTQAKKVSLALAATVRKSFKGKEGAVYDEDMMVLEQDGHQERNPDDEGEMSTSDVEIMLEQDLGLGGFDGFDLSG